MGRSHAWVLRGNEYIEPRPMNWGTNLTMIGAIRLDRWLTMGTLWGATNKDNFTDWVRRCLVPKLRCGDIVVMDNLKAHKDPRVADLIEAHGASVKYLPPYSPDLNPIESGWALIKKRIRAVAPREKHALRRAARHARHVIKPHHCHNWFDYAGFHPHN